MLLGANEFVADGTAAKGNANTFRVCWRTITVNDLYDKDREEFLYPLLTPSLTKEVAPGPSGTMSELLDVCLWSHHPEKVVSISKRCKRLPQLLPTSLLLCIYLAAQ